MRPMLSIGMATYEDFDGVYFTTQALRMYHDLTDCEIIVVDNKPDGNAAKYLGYLKTLPNVRYIPMSSPVGTAQPRNRVFEEAQGDYVLCIDGHILMLPGAIARLKQYYQEHPETKDLVSGPILWDGLDSGATHFDDFWRAEMLGIWGQAWECKCHSESFMRAPLQFSVLQHVTPEQPFCQYRLLKPGNQPAQDCPRCGRALPQLPFNGHQQTLVSMGYRPLGNDPNGQPFEVPGQGLGLFSCRKDTWEHVGGFNKLFRGFGGEEMYIHEKIRRNGGKVWCLPFLGWNHRFARPDGVKFPLLRYQKVRNYVLGAQELGQSLDAIEEHFVKSGLMPREQWDKLLASPESENIPPECETCSQNNGRPLPPIDADTPDKIMTWCKEVPRDINQHLPKLAELAAHCQTVVEFTGRRESTVGLLAGVARSGGKLLSYNTEGDRLLSQMVSAYPNHLTLQATDSVAVQDIPETDMLFLDTVHNFDRVYGELTKFAPKTKRFIVLHDTVSFGQGGEGGGAGLWEAIKRYTQEHPEWFLAWHTNDQYGLSVLAKQEQDRPPQPVQIWPKEKGPGTELKAILSSLNINPAPGCDCNRRAQEMNDMGVDQCRARFDEIVGWLREGQERWGWGENFRNFAAAGIKAIFSGLAFKVSWTDPLPDLVRLAIDNAEKKEKEEQNNG